jgi:signal transduction histidine kinase/CheY-like chemotaxis protein
VVLQVTTTRRRAQSLAEAMTAAVRSGEGRLHETMAEMEAARDMALDANRAKSDFLATMSHEIRTPLNGIIGTTQLLADGDATTQQRRHLSTIRYCASSLLVIINGLLDLSKVEAGKLELESVSFSLPELLGAALGMFEERARAKGVALSRELAPQLPQWVQGDPLRLQQVLINLVSNALKFTSRGRVLIRVEREPGPPSQLVRFTVEDTGDGIPPEARDRLFQAFSQADSSTSRTHGGTGLGLLICQKLASLMGGRIGFESERGRGSTFWFSANLPQAEPGTREDAAPAQAVPVPPLDNAVPLPLPALDESRPSPPARAPGTAAHVLLVEDNPINQMIARAMLVKRGLVVHTAGNGRLALEALAGNTFDLVLMDCQMPEMDGFEATGAIRRENRSPRRIPIVALTANAMASDRARCLEAGMDDYLTKPLDTNELDRVLRRWLSSSNPSVAGT